MKVSVIIPVFNEEESLPELYQELRALFDSEPWEGEAIMVDDGSTDNTFVVLANLQPQDDHLTVIQLRRTYGKAAALAMGFLHPARNRNNMAEIRVPEWAIPTQKTKLIR